MPKMAAIQNFNADISLSSLPQLLLDVDAIEDNIALKEQWAAARSMVLAPHIKTTMTREIVQRQLPGSWGVTVATPAQAAHAVGWGVRRILIANEVVFPPLVAELRRLLVLNPTVELYCLVDSESSVAVLAAGFQDADRPLHVLLDVGVAGGRTGIRAAADAPGLSSAIRSAPGLRFAGVSAYEGIAPNVRTPENLGAIDAHCQAAVRVFDGLHGEFEVEQPLYSVGGSAFQDRAAQFLPEGSLNVLRSGCYVVHDSGTYAEVSPLPGLRAAAVVRAVVLSVPEEGRAIIGAGKRELAYDAGLPTLVAHHREGRTLAEPTGVVVRLFDHHAVVDEAGDLRVGDIVDLGISHPCSVFDRWRTALAVHGNLTEVWHPQF
jgi:D-serine deaminase-like pyridoxal phosphate-dependent protein